MTDTTPLERADKRLALITWILGALAVILIGLGIWGGFTQSQATHASDRALRAVHEVNASRIENTWQACFSGDRKSVDARDAVESLIAQAPSGQRSGVAQFRLITVTLLKSFLPYNDCPAQLRERFNVSYPATVPDARHDWLVLQREHASQAAS